MPGAPQLLYFIENALAKVWIYENVVIAEVVPGVEINYKNTFDLVVKGVNYIDFKPWAYISHRIHAYDVDPKFYKYIHLIPHLKGMAVVIPKESTEYPEIPTKETLKKEIAVFDDLSSAYIWAKELLENLKK